MILPLRDIATFTEAQTVLAPADETARACGVTWDSRQVQPGFLYVALTGQRVDGHDFAGAALTLGALAVLASHPLGQDALDLARKRGAAVFQVPDTEAALTRLAGAYRRTLTATVVGITGSTGKTTTKNLVRDVLSAQFKTVATKSNQNNELGVPNTILAADPDTEFLVVEMGMRGAGQIAQLCSFAAPDWGLVTNVGESHIELLGSRENIANAKAELVGALGPGGIAFLNASCDFKDAVAARVPAHARVVLFDGANNPAADVWAEDVELDARGCSSFYLACEAGRVRCTLELHGVHNVSNACSAAAVGLAAGMCLEQIAAALMRSCPESGRQELRVSPVGVTVMDDSYNANPDSMCAALATFAALRVEGRRLAVLGDMGELGPFAKEAHERVGAKAAAAGLDGLVCVGPLSERIAAGACQGGMPASAIVRCDTREEALAFVRGWLLPGDAVLVKASRFMGLDLIVKELMS